MRVEVESLQATAKQLNPTETYVHVVFENTEQVLVDRGVASNLGVFAVYTDKGVAHAVRDALNKLHSSENFYVGTLVLNNMKSTNQEAVQCYLEANGFVSVRDIALRKVREVCSEDELFALGISE